MKVKDLIAALQMVDEDKDVMFRWYDTEAEENRFFNVIQILESKWSNGETDTDVTVVLE